MKQIFKLLLWCAIAFWGGLGFISPAWGTHLTESASTQATTPLTLELLQEQLNSPQQQDGMTVLDLSHFMIDLTAENSEFREQFYQKIHQSLESSNIPLGLDFSHSIIQGKFNLTPLTRKIPLVWETFSTVLTPAELQVLQEQSPLFAEEKTPEIQESQSQTQYINLFRGTLQFNETEFQGETNFSNTVFLHRLEITKSIFEKVSHWENNQFLRQVNFSGTRFLADVDFSGVLWAKNPVFCLTQFSGNVKFLENIFKTLVNFSQSTFSGVTDWTGSQWEDAVDFSQVTWKDRVLFNKNRFLKSLDFSNNTFEKAVAFRSSRFNADIDFTEVSLLDQVDFSDAVFLDNEKVTVQLIVSGLAFDAENARIFGDKGQIGKVITVSNLAGNENTLRHLVRNFRKLEQIPDANQVDYTFKQLQLEELTIKIIGTPFDFSFFWRRGVDLLNWLRVSVLLLLSEYGTNFNLVLSIGGVAIAYFSVLIWFVDRYRRKTPTPIVPPPEETRWMLGSFTLLILGSLTGIWQTSHHPYFTLLCLILILLPVPLILLLRLYRQGRYHNLLETPYLVENGAERQLRISIGILPIMPKYMFFRDRYFLIPWDRRWNWLNYYGFSLNTFLKLSFNDLRLRDEHLPGLVSTLVWYQWSLGILYIVLLFWTLSRTIPGLNLLLYLS